MPLRKWPKGKIRFKFRTNSFAIAFVRAENGIRKYHISQNDGFWEPGILIAENLTIK